MPGWLIVARGALQLEFFPHPALDPWANYAGCCLRVADARALHAAFGAAGLPTDPGAIPRLTAPVDQPWGFREFALVDADGNLLRGLEPLGAQLPALLERWLSAHGRRASDRIVPALPAGAVIGGVALGGLLGLVAHYVSEGWPRDARVLP